MLKPKRLLPIFALNRKWGALDVFRKKFVKLSPFPIQGARLLLALKILRKKYENNRQTAEFLI